MKPEKKKLCVTLLIGLSLTTIKAQEAVPASGGDASGSGGSVSFSVGQQVYVTHAGAPGSMAEGVQQTYEISPVTGLTNRTINLNINAYPNPTNDFLTLSVADRNYENLSYQLIDLSGRILETKKTENSTTDIFIGRYTYGAYFLKVLQGDKEVKTFKIIRQ